MKKSEFLTLKKELEFYKKSCLDLSEKLISPPIVLDHVMYDIVPMGAPRMTRADAWRTPVRDCVARYRVFKDLVKIHKVSFENGDGVRFVVPMPKSWGKTKKNLAVGQPCTSKPDLDNMLKALMDSIYGEDAHIWNVSRLEKVWGFTGRIIIYKKRLGA